MFKLCSHRGKLQTLLLIFLCKILACIILILVPCRESIDVFGYNLRPLPITAKRQYSSDNSNTPGLTQRIQLENKMAVENQLENKADFLNQPENRYQNSDSINVKKQDQPSNITHPLTIYDNPYIIQNSDICQKAKLIKFLVVVHSSTTNFEQRLSTRNTWANVKIQEAFSMRIVFLLGKPVTHSTQEDILRENDCFGDIVQGDFMDSYHNLTHKAVLGLRWITENCRQAKFIVKVDDDVFVNIFKIVGQLTSEYDITSRTIFGEMRIRDAIHRKGQWKVEEKEFANMKYWPFQFCVGYFVMVTSELIPELYEQAKTTPFLWLDDVYVYGLLASKLDNIRHTNLTNITCRQDLTLKCFKEQGIECPLVVANARSTHIKNLLWAIALDQMKQTAANDIIWVANATCHSNQ